MIAVTTGMTELPCTCLECPFREWDLKPTSSVGYSYCRVTDDVLDSYDLVQIRPGHDSACPLIEIDTNGGDKNA